jgi:hypothetical protein
MLSALMGWRSFEMAAARGRKPGFVMSDEHRVKIQNSNILNALVEHVVGKREMSPTQVSAGIALLKKVLPDLSGVTLSGDPESPIETVTRIELVALDANPTD